MDRLGQHVQSPVAILYLDSNAEDRRQVATTIDATLAGVTVETAESPSDARDRIASSTTEEYAALITEYPLGETDAIAFTGDLHNDDVDIPLVLFTDEGSERVATDALAAGIDGYVCKDHPASIDRLREQLERVTGRRLERAPSLETLTDVVGEFEACRSAKETYQLAVDIIDRWLTPDASAMFVEQETPMTTRVSGNFDAVAVSVSGFDRTHIDDPIFNGIAGQANRVEQTTVVDPTTYAKNAAEPIASVRSVLAVPVESGGVLTAISTDPNAFNSVAIQFVEFLRSLVSSTVGRIEAIKALHDERNQFDSLFESVPDAVVRNTRTEDGRVVDVNPAFEAIFGYDRSEIVGDSLESHIVPEEDDPIDIYATVGLTDVVTAEVERITADGRRDFLFRGFATRAGDEVHEYGIYTDITDQKQHERTLERQNERLERFAETVSHDLRNPLTLARGHLGMLEAGPEEPDDHVEEIGWALERMDELIENVLSLARTGTRLTETEQVELQDVVANAHRTVDPDLEVVCDGPLPTVEADPDRLAVLFENAFRNAREHVGPDATVRIARTGDGFAIADDGAGIPAEKRQQIFQSGYSTRDDGTGFGLAIVAEAVDAHGWSITAAESESGGLELRISTADS